jgi:hypothetical protein
VDGTAILDDAPIRVVLPESWDTVEIPETLPGRALDLDRDGLDDLLVGNPRSAYGAGRVSVILGLDPGEQTLDEVASVTLYGEPGEALGTTLAAGADLDGDSVGDAVLGGAAGLRLLFGGGCPILGPTRVDARARTLALGDLDADGRAEIYLGDETAGLEGGPAGGWVLRADAQGGLEPWLAGDAAGALLGTLLGAVGDVDGAPGDDLVVASATGTTRLGRACGP